MIHVGLKKYEDDDEDSEEEREGYIRFFGYERGEMQAGQAVLEKADAQDWTYTEWLGIEDDFQGKGFGKFLLQYSLQEMQKAGYRHASISTSLDNYRAILFYSNVGYKVVDWTYEYQKTIK
ncbi:GNAT family N-acetyltransferase [Candidatus Poribacteria bacterium]|nr:GNAT family N-acetyltransferase [Candidatus Poribacteria bacterium]